MNKAIFLDRDGTINVDFGYVYKTQELELLPGVAEALRIFQELGYLLIVITNQSGIGRGYFTLEDAEQFNRALAQELEKHGVILNDFYTCPHAPEEHCECRKPSPFMVTEAMKKYDIDPSQSYMFGDKKSDTECGERSGVKSFRVTEEHPLIYWANQLKTTYYERRIKQYKGKEGACHRRRDAGYLPHRGRERISPEAPVPVVRVTRTYNVLGGAANVARNLLGLGCSPYVVSLLGNDHNGNTMQEMFADLGIRNELFHTEHPTITKTRVIGNSQQVVRLDFETENECLNEETEQKLLDAVKRALPEVDIVVISDYGKGMQ